MSVVDEVISSLDQTTTFVNGELAFTPRMRQIKLNAELAVWISNTPKSNVSYYAVGVQSGVLYYAFEGATGMNLSQVLQQAYTHILLWIRPKNMQGYYSDPVKDRDDALKHLNSAIHELYGVSALNHVQSYHEQRRLEVNSNDVFVYDLTRLYDPVKDQIITKILQLPEGSDEVEAVGVVHHDVTATYSVHPAWLDPGDFLPGVWTPDPNDDPTPTPVDEPHPDNVLK